tara:strand:- start:807 stop:5483 length:4677 start_codon:yes stop_codon:yes gene_type:complete
MAISVEEAFKQESKRKEKSKEDQVGFIESALAGVATGLWNIPKTAFSLGATVFDLIGDTNTARAVEKWFDDVNPWDDEAEARTVGRITQALAQIAIPATYGFKVGSTAAKAWQAKNATSIAQKALAAKKNGNYFSLAKAGELISKPRAWAAATPGRASLTGGVIGGGLAEAVVADEDIGTFADMAEGTSLEPFAITMMDKNQSLEGRADAYRRLTNRLKFGTEGALFNLAIVGAAKGVQTLRRPSEEGLEEYSKNAIKQDYEKFGPKYGLRPEGTGTKSIHEMKGFHEGTKKSIDFAASQSVKELDSAFKGLGDNFYNEYLSANKSYANTKSGQELFSKDLLDKVIAPIKKDKFGRDIIKEGDLLLKPEAKKRVMAELDQVRKFKQLQFKINELRPKLENPKLNFKAKQKLNADLATLRKNWKNLIEKNPNIIELWKRVEQKGLFNSDDYIRTTDKNLKGSSAIKLKSMMESVKKSGGNAVKMEDAIINMRMSIDNMSARTGLNQVTDQTYGIIKNNLGKYMTKVYRHWEQRGVFGLNRYKPAAEEIDRSIQAYKDSRLMSERRKILDNKIKTFKATNKVDTISKDVLARLEKEAIDEVAVLTKNPGWMKAIEDDASRDVGAFVKKITTEDQTAKEAARTGAGDIDVKELDQLKIDNTILKKQVLEPWERELMGQIKDPSYNFYSTISKQSHLNSTLKIMDDISKMGSQGPNRFVVSADEVSNILDPVTGKVDATKWKQVKGISDIATPLDGMYIKAPYYDAIFNTTSNWLDRKSSVGLFYKYAVLGPKATSQIAKTILSPLTHIRNALSAGAFVSANGAFFPNYGDLKLLMPFGKDAVWRKAWGISGRRALGTMSKADERLYQRLLKVGVVDSQVQSGEIKQLLNDILKDPTAVERGLGTKIPVKHAEKLRRAALRGFAKAQDTYVAEDDFWKAINWNLERNRYSKVIESLKINKDNFKSYLNPATEQGKTSMGKYFQKMAQRKSYINSATNKDEAFTFFLDEIAGKLTRNQVPNYAYVGRTARALRQTPFGNFIAFPLEIMRTGNNIYTQAIDEITAGVGRGSITKPEVAALRDIGLKRLFSFGATVVGVPTSLVAMGKAYHDVDNEEMDALRRMVPEWSKNSTLIPMGRDENGYLKYIDFSYSNAYDTLTRPFMAITTALSQSDGSRDSLMKALGTGMQDSFSEIMKPYATESIYTERLLDSVIRRGVGRGGKRVWNEEDDFGVKVGKGIWHMAESLTPGSISQFNRIQQSARGKTDEYGKLYNINDEIHGLYGMRIVNSDPERSMKYKVTKFGSSLKKGDNLFIAPLLKGGRVSPEEIIDRYRYAESRRFAALKEMYQDIEAAKTLGMSNSKIKKELRKRRGISKNVVSQVIKGEYSPKPPSDFFKSRMRKINRELNELEGVNIPNPYLLAKPFIRQIRMLNKKINLLNDYIKIPDINIERKATGGRVGMQGGGEPGDKELAMMAWTNEPETVKESFEYSFDKYYASGVWMDKLPKQTEEAPKTPLPETPPVDPKLVSQMVNTNVMQTGLTPTEQALLSQEEKSIKLRQRGIAR